MHTAYRILLSLLLGSLALSPLAAFAQSSTSTATTSQSSGSGSTGALIGIGVGVGVGVAALSALSSSGAAPVGLSSFGGRVISATPCISPLGPAIFTVIRSSKLSDLGRTRNYIWTPATITKMAGPPSHPGQEILGLADVPYACWNPFKGGLFGLFTFLKYSYGQRMTLVGTSVI